MKEKVWINNKFVDSKDAKVSVFDRGFMYGDGVFETMRSYAGVVFKLDEHIKRLYSSLAVLGIRKPYSKSVLESIICRSLKVNGLKSAYIKVVVTRGQGRFGVGYKDKFLPNTVVVTKSFDGYPSWMFERGLSAEVAGIRQNEQSVLSRIKSLNFLPYIIARFEAKDMGYDEAVLSNTKGHIAEAATSNIFMVKNERLITPSLLSGILPGIARSTVIQIGRKIGLKVKEAMVSRKELESADEVFLTNSLAEVLPVTRIGKKRIGSGKPGPVTKLLHISYQKEVIKTVIR